MPHQHIPENPQEWQYAPVPRVLPEREYRQFLIVDIPYILLAGYLTLFGYGLAAHLKILAGSCAAVAMLACALYLLHTARAFLMELYRPSSEKEKVGKRVWNRLWGWRDDRSREFAAKFGAQHLG